MGRLILADLCTIADCYAFTFTIAKTSLSPRKSFSRSISAPPFSITAPDSAISHSTLSPSPHPTVFEHYPVSDTSSSKSTTSDSSASEEEEEDIKPFIHTIMSSPKKYRKATKLLSTKSKVQAMKSLVDNVTTTAVVAPSPVVVKPVLSKVLQEASRKASEAAMAKLNALKAELAIKNAAVDKGKSKEVVVAVAPVAPIVVQKVVENSTETDVTAERKERKALKKAIKAVAVKTRAEAQIQAQKGWEPASNSGTASPARKLLVVQPPTAILSSKKQKKRAREDSPERQQPIASTSATPLRDDQPSKAKKIKKNSTISTSTLVNKNLLLSTTPSRPVAPPSSTSTPIAASNSKKRKAPTTSTPTGSTSTSSYDSILARSEAQRQATVNKIVSSLIASNPSMAANRIPLPPLPPLASTSSSGSTSASRSSSPVNQLNVVLDQSRYNGPDILRFLSFSFLGMNDLVENGNLQIAAAPLSIAAAAAPRISQKGKEKERLVDVGVNTIIDKAAEEASRLLLEQQGEEILELEMKAHSMEEEIARLAADKLKSEADQQKKLEDKQRKKERKALGLAKKLKEDTAVADKKEREKAVLAAEQEKLFEVQLEEARMVEEIASVAKKESKKIAKANKKALKAEKKAKKLAKVIASRQKTPELEVESDSEGEDTTMAVDDLVVVVEELQTEDEEESDSIEEVPVLVEEIVKSDDDDLMVSAEELDEIVDEEKSKESEDDVEAFESAPENVDEIVSASTLPKSSSPPISVTSEPVRLSSPIQLDSVAPISNGVEESEAEPSTADESEEEIDQLAGSTPKVEHPSSRAFKDSTPSSPEDAAELALSLSQHASPDRRRTIPALTRLGGSQPKALTTFTSTSSTPLHTSATLPFTPVVSTSIQSPVVTIGAGNNEDSSSSDEDEEEDEEEEQEEEDFDIPPPKAKKARTSIGASAFAAFGKSTPKPLLKTPTVVVEKPLLDLEIDDEEYDQLMSQPSQSVRADRILAAVEAEEAEEEFQESELEEGEIVEARHEKAETEPEVKNSSRRISGGKAVNGTKVNALVGSQKQAIPAVEEPKEEVIEETQDEEVDQLASQYPTPNLIPPTPDSKVVSKHGRSTTPRPNSLPAGLLEFVDGTKSAIFPGFTPPESRTMHNSSQLSLPEEGLTLSNIDRKTFSDAGDSPHIPISDDEGSPRPEESQFVPLVKEPLFSLDSQSQSQSQSISEQNVNGGSYVSKRNGNGSPSKITSIASPTANFSIEIEVPRNGLLSPPRARQTRSATSRSPSPGTHASQPIINISNVRGTPRRDMFSQPEPGNSIGSIASNRRLASKLPGLDALPSGSISRRSSRNVGSSQVSTATPTKVNWKGKSKADEEEDEEDDSDNEVIVKGKGKGKAKLWE